MLQETVRHQMPDMTRHTFRHKLITRKLNVDYIKSMFLAPVMATTEQTASSKVWLLLLHTKEAGDTADQIDMATLLLHARLVKKQISD